MPEEEVQLPDETSATNEVVGHFKDADGSITITTQKFLKNLKTGSKVADGSPVSTKLKATDVQALHDAQSPVLDPIVIAIGEGTYSSDEAPAAQSANETPAELAPAPEAENQNKETPAGEEAAQ